MAADKIKGTLKYVVVNGTGINSSIDPTKEDYKYSVSVIFDKDSKELKEFQALLEDKWTRAKATDSSIKGKLVTNLLKEETLADPTGAIDPDTDRVKRIPTGKIIATFRTSVFNTHFNKPNVIKVFNARALDITDELLNAEWSIGNNSTGIVFATIGVNKGGGTAKISGYLNKLQLLTLEKYSPDGDVDVVEGYEDIETNTEIQA